VKDHQRFVQHGSRQPPAKFAVAPESAGLTCGRCITPLHSFFNVFVADEHTLGDQPEESSATQKFKGKILLLSVCHADSSTCTWIHKAPGARRHFRGATCINLPLAIYMRLSSSVPRFAL
jgi:hypothetical protein